MSASDTLIGRTFDTRYVIERKLGSGGMADVYLAEDQELGRRVALKLLDDRHASDEQFVERFRREAQSAASLNHPSIVSIFDRGHAEGTYYIAMEYLDGRTLKELLVKNGPTPVPIAIDYARQILGALAFAHRNGIVHRDIKPHNIVVGGDGRLKVTDFGIARSGASQMTEAGSIVGTAQYLSPEQARGAPVDPRSDIYSLGVVLYEMLTGKVPFSGDTPVEIAMKHLSQVPEPPSKLRDGIPHDLDAIVMRALAKDPEQRYATAEEMDADLARVARGVAVSRETEDAMTQVLSGAGISTAQTMIQRPRTNVSPPAPPAYRSPGYYDYEEPPRGRSIWPWLLGARADHRRRDRRLVPLHEDPGSAEQQQAGRRARRTSAPTGSREAEDPAGRAEPADHQGNERHGGAGSGLQRGPAEWDEDRQGLDGDALGLDGEAEGAGPERGGPGHHGGATTLAGEGLQPKIRRIFSDSQPDTVTAQQPHAGDSVIKGTVVHINVSRGAKPVPIPDVTGQPYANAKSMLEGQGFQVGRTEIQSDMAQGVVVAETPQAGTSVPRGTKITLSVSKGPATTQVPDVTGMSQSTAESLLTGAGLTPSVVYDPVTDPAQDGIVQPPTPRRARTRSRARS